MTIDLRQYARHAQLFNAPFHQKIMVVGAGAIGSRLVVALVKLGCTNIQVYDPDVVEAHNIGNQIFGPAHIGRRKVSALDHYFRSLGYTEPAFTGNIEKVTKDSPVNFAKTHVFLAVDSMAARREIIEAHCTKSWWVYDTRIGVDHSTMVVFNPAAHLPDYWNTWAPDDKIPEDSPCGTRITIDATAQISTGIIVKEFMLRTVGDGKQWAFIHYSHPTITQL